MKGLVQVPCATPNAFLSSSRLLRKSKVFGTWMPVPWIKSVSPGCPDPAPSCRRSILDLLERARNQTHFRISLLHWVEAVDGLAILVGHSYDILKARKCTRHIAGATRATIHAKAGVCVGYISTPPSYLWAFVKLSSGCFF